MIQTQTSRRYRSCVWNCLKQGEVVVDLAAGQERAHSGTFQGNLKSEHFGVELNRCGNVSYVKNQVADSFWLCHENSSSGNYAQECALANKLGIPSD